MVRGTKRQKLAFWVLEHSPPLLVAETERVGLSVGFIGVGIISILNINERPAFGSETVNHALIINWACTLILGGICTIWGMNKSNRTVERAGLLLSMIGCITYAIVAIFAGTTLTALVVATLFLALGGIKFIRLMISSATRSNAARVNGDAHG
jgi:hypothetical protein